MAGHQAADSQRARWRSSRLSDQKAEYQCAFRASGPGPPARQRNRHAGQNDKREKGDPQTDQQNPEKGKRGKPSERWPFQIKQSRHKINSQHRKRGRLRHHHMLVNHLDRVYGEQQRRAQRDPFLHTEEPHQHRAKQPRRESSQHHLYRDDHRQQMKGHRENPDQVPVDIRSEVDEVNAERVHQKAGGIGVEQDLGIEQELNDFHEGHTKSDHYQRSSCDSTHQSDGNMERGSC